MHYNCIYSILYKVYCITLSNNKITKIWTETVWLVISLRKCLKIKQQWKHLYNGNALNKREGEKHLNLGSIIDTKAYFSL